MRPVCTQPSSLAGLQDYSEMDSLLPQLLGFPPHPPPADPLPDAEYDKQIKAIVHTLGSVSASKLTGGVRGGGDLLDVRWRTL